MPVLICTWIDIFDSQDIVDDSLAVFQIEQTVEAGFTHSWEVTIRPVVVGHDDKFLIWINLLALIFQITDTTGIWVGQFAFAVVFIRLGNVKLIGNTVDNIKVISPVVSIDQILRLAIKIIPTKLCQTKLYHITLN